MDRASIRRSRAWRRAILVRRVVFITRELCSVENPSNVSWRPGVSAHGQTTATGTGPPAGRRVGLGGADPRSAVSQIEEQRAWAGEEDAGDGVTFRVHRTGATQARGFPGTPTVSSPALLSTRPIAQKLVAAIARHVQGKVVDLKVVIAGRTAAGEKIVPYGGGGPNTGRLSHRTGPRRPSSGAGGASPRGARPRRSRQDRRRRAARPQGRVR